MQAEEVEEAEEATPIRNEDYASAESRPPTVKGGGDEEEEEDDDEEEDDRRARVLEASLAAQEASMEASMAAQREDIEALRKRAKQAKEKAKMNRENMLAAEEAQTAASIAPISWIASPEEKATVTDAFSRLDLDGDGVITREEWEAASGVEPNEEGEGHEIILPLPIPVADVKTMIETESLLTLEELENIHEKRKDDQKKAERAQMLVNRVAEQKGQEIVMSLVGEVRSLEDVSEMLDVVERFCDGHGVSTAEVSEEEETPVTPSPPLPLSGWLWKKAGGGNKETFSLGGRNWNRRWFTLNNGVLSYFEDPSEKIQKGFTKGAGKPIWSGDLRSKGDLKCDSKWDGSKKRSVLQVAFKSRILTVGSSLTETEKARREEAAVLRSWEQSLLKHHSWVNRAARMSMPRPNAVIVSDGEIVEGGISGALSTAHLKKE